MVRPQCHEMVCVRIAKLLVCQGKVCVCENWHGEGGREGGGDMKEKGTERAREKEKRTAREGERYGERKEERERIWYQSTKQILNYQTKAQLHLEFCKDILGVNGKPSSPACRAELRRLPLITGMQRRAFRVLPSLHIFQPHWCPFTEQKTSSKRPF